jgi:hypothetical protein
MRKELMKGFFLSEVVLLGSGLAMLVGLLFAAAAVITSAVALQ